MIDQPVKFKGHHAGNDLSVQAISGGGRRDYLASATNTTHVIYQLRNFATLQTGEHTLKGFVARGSDADTDVKMQARRPRNDKRSDGDYSFLVSGVVNKAGDKVSMGHGTPLIIVVDTITAE